MRVSVPSTKGIRLVTWKDVDTTLLQSKPLLAEEHYLRQHRAFCCLGQCIPGRALHRGRLDVCCAASTNRKWSVGISVVGHSVNVSFVFVFFFSPEL